jgi:hypothetical protein
MCELAHALPLTRAEAAYDVVQEQLNGYAAPEPPPPKPRPSSRARLDQHYQYIRDYACKSSAREDYARARGHLQEALVVISGMDLDDCAVGQLYAQLVGKVKDALAELNGFGRYVLVVDQGGRPRKVQP